MRQILFYSVVLVFLSIVAMIAYQFASTFSYTRHINLPTHLLASSTNTTAGGDISVADVYGQIDPIAFNPASSTLDIASWKMYVNNELGFSVQYPSDFILNTNTPGSLILFVPKEHYFHWPLLDDVKISITATSSCPSVISGAFSPKPISVLVNGYTFDRVEGSDVGAGNLYRELAYDYTNKNFCYHIDLFDHGTNGAGFYVSDQSLITQYDSQHQTDLDALVAIFNAVVKSFHVIKTPAGSVEN